MTVEKPHSIRLVAVASMIGTTIEWYDFFLCGSAMDRFAQMDAGTISPAEFFAPESIGAINAASREGAVTA